MRPAGYMLKRIVPAPEWVGAAPGTQICSLSECVNENFTDYIQHWRHNGYWLFDAPEIGVQIAEADRIALSDLTLLYYEAHDLAYAEEGRRWFSFGPDPRLTTNVVPATDFELLGYDVVTFSTDALPECSPLSCNGLAREANANSFCLLDTLEDARLKLDAGFFDGSEPGPFRIYSVWRSRLGLE